MAALFDGVYPSWGNPTMATVSYWMIVAVITERCGLIEVTAMGRRAGTAGS